MFWRWVFKHSYFVFWLHMGMPNLNSFWKSARCSLVASVLLRILVSLQSRIIPSLVVFLCLLNRNFAWGLLAQVDWENLSFASYLRGFDSLKNWHLLWRKDYSQFSTQWLVFYISCDDVWLADQSLLFWCFIFSDMQSRETRGSITSMCGEVHLVSLFIFCEL